MSPAPTPDAVNDALVGRLRVALAALGGPVGGGRAAAVADASPASPGDVAAHIRALAERVRVGGGREAWLAYIALSANYPTPEAVARLSRATKLASERDLVAEALSVTSDELAYFGRATRSMSILPRDELVVDVTFCASYGHNTGIQRVVRNLVPHWVSDGRPLRLVRWSPVGGGYVELNDDERLRVLEWRSGIGDSPSTVGTIRDLVVPWGVDVFLPEVPAAFEVAELAALAEFSGNSVSLLGYDTIPIGSADTFPAEEPERFARYLGVVKRSRKVVAISRSAGGEFWGFASGLPTQGLAEPEIVAVPLATEAPGLSDGAGEGAGAGAAEGLGGSATELPVVLCVGSHEPRKNQEAVLAAASVLFGEGLRFRLVFVGGGTGEVLARFDREVGRWKARGMAVESHRRLGDRELWELYRQARFTVLLSLHEGFGLPIVESTSLGTPVLTSSHGSLAEVAALGGCLTANPRDDEAVTDAMRRMLTDDALIARLEAEIATLPTRTWHDYADEVWAALGFRSDAEQPA